jgi:4'-phosphopantetheinyl transferase
MSGEVTVRWGSLDGQPLDRFVPLLTREERARAESFKFARDRSRFIAARGLLRTLLAQRLGLDPRRVEFAYGEHGKPRLAGDGEPRFNVSHSDGLMAIALCEDREVGIDIEAQRAGRSIDGISRRYLPPALAEEIERASGAERDRAFYRAWVRQEAYAKACGAGLELIGEPPDPERWSIADLDLAEGFSAAVAVEGATPGEVITTPI